MEKVEKLDFRTTWQRERQERAEKVYARYLEIKDVAPSERAIWRVLSKEVGMTMQGVRYIVVRREKRPVKKRKAKKNPFQLNLTNYKSV
jgi:hypothetical protein